MAGIYIHIPFCKKACHYCNFHFSTSLKYKAEMLEAIHQELKLQRDFLENQMVETIYLGGGTPSLLSEVELAALFEKINQYYTIGDHPEVTLEANPDDLTLEQIKALRQSPVNRLSIGIQSFWEEDLQFMNRAHTAKEAEECLENVLEQGFRDITIDLIYGTPTMDQSKWATNIEKVFRYKIPHISCYCLTVEPNTALSHFVAAGKTKDVDDQQAAQQFEYLMDQMEQKGYEHYEISNFALPNRYSKHNSNYWRGVPYLGIGPSAHSFDGQSRYWNIAHNQQYIKAIQAGQIPNEQERLTPANRYNEMILTTLRTTWGLDSSTLETKFQQYFFEQVQPLIQAGTVLQNGTTFKLSRQGRLFADRIAADLFWET